MTRILLVSLAVSASWLWPFSGHSLKSPDAEVISGRDGAPAIVIDGQPNAPLLFVGNNQFGRDHILLNEIRQAHEAGIDIFGFNVHLDSHWTAEKSAETIDTFCAANPEGYFYLRIWLGPNGKWLDAHPKECIVKADGTRVNRVSPASKLWRKDTARMLRDRVREIARGPHGSQFLGVCLANMQTGEWFYRDTNDFMDYSEPNLRAFRAWLRDKYGSDNALRKAWGDPDVTFRTAVFPSAADREQAAWGPFRDPVQHRAAMDMQVFQSELVADTMAFFCKVVKDATKGKALVGVFYGYAMELNHNGPRALAHSGHLSFSRLLDCEAVDLVHAPYSYYERKLGQPGHFHLPVDSVALHGKLALLEEDTYTHLAQPPGEGLIAPGWADRTKSLEETLAINRRNFGNFLGHRCGMWFFDLLSDGRWESHDFWRSTGLLRRIAAETRSTPLFRPEVAVLVDEASVHTMRANTHPYLYQALGAWRAELDRLGMPVGYYLLDDLELLPDSVKVLILPNAFLLTEKHKSLLSNRLQEGSCVLWHYAPGIYGPEGADPNRVSETIGMKVEAKFDSVPPAAISTLTGEKFSAGRTPWQPRFVVSDPDAEPLAKYIKTDEVCAAVVNTDPGLSVYTALPRLPDGVLRWLCEQSGVHVYTKTPMMTAVMGDYLIVHTDKKRQHEFRWPTVCSTIERVVPYRRTPLARETRVWADRLEANTTAIYRCK